MSSPAPPSPRQFAEKFREGIRVGFNWERFLAEKWPIERISISDRAILGRCFMPWYIGKSGEDVAYDDAAGAPMSLTDVPKAMEILNDERKGDLQEKIEKLQRGDAGPRLIVPSYGLPDGNFFIMDRNHRLSAIMLTSGDFEIELWNVLGPHEEDCLMDLNHWLRKEDA
jgi:hypothetical protein